MKANSWSLKYIKLSNILGFFGEKEFHFSQGLQVIEADNHVGKTSFAIALLWGLTGQLPEIGRITENRFKLKNKQASAKDSASVTIVLENGNKEKLEIYRSTDSGAKKHFLKLQLNGMSFEEGAQEIISSQLGLKPQSLEGCSVILQDQRLSLITGDLAKSSKVIHDILGLSTLSKLVPIIKEKISGFNRLLKEFKDNDAVKKWETRHSDLKRELEFKENEAIAKGYDRQIFKSNFLEHEFEALFKGLGIQSSVSSKPFKELVNEARDFIESKRKQNPYRSQIDQSSHNILVVNDILTKMQSVIANLKKMKEEYQHLQKEFQLTLPEIVPALQKYENETALKQSALDALKEQNGLFSYSLSLLKKETNSNHCPLCKESIDREKLIKDIEEKLGESIAKSINALEADLTKITQNIRKVKNLELTFINQEGRLRGDIEYSINVLSSLEKCKPAAEWLQNKREHLALNEIVEIADRMDGLYVNIQNYLAKIHQEHENIKNLSQEFDKTLKPLDDKLCNITMYLMPIHDIHIKVLEHDKCRNERLNQKEGHQALLELTQKYATQLEDLVLFLQAQEKKKANNIIQEHQDFVSDFFAKVADHPFYDKISITPKDDRGSIKYDFEAESSKAPVFTDHAKHVLSGSDLSVACLGLMLSLTKGKANKTGFIVLDDPGESFDEIRMDNFSREIDKISHQTIILTHQRDFANKLRQHGASFIPL